ncbi:MAG: hypothetical protein GVY29_04755 [Spirochaetes bacterium]|nr:hypothetical protein [Spirochaetota bacterium]
MDRSTLSVLAEYNRLTNRELFQILFNTSRSVLTRELASPLTSILGILNHILASDVTWIRRMSAGAPSLESLSGELGGHEITSVFAILHSDLVDLRDDRERIDEMLIRLVSTVSDADLGARFSYHNSSSVTPSCTCSTTRRTTAVRFRSSSMKPTSTTTTAISSGRWNEGCAPFSCRPRRRARAGILRLRLSPG